MRQRGPDAEMGGASMTWLALAAITVAAAVGFTVLALRVQEHAVSGPIFRNYPRLHRKGQSYMAWFICAVAALVIVGGLTYGTRHHAQVATNAPPQTTGQSGPSTNLTPVPPKPTDNEPATDGL
jgi:phosphate/sulfate permease